MKCKHPFKEINRQGTCECPLCGAEFQYDTTGKKDPTILKEGIDFDSINPREISRDRKAVIARTAKAIGLKKVIAATGLSAALVGGWIGVYTRDWGKFRTKYRQTAKEKKGVRKEARPGVAVAFHAFAEIHQIHIVSFNPLHQCCLCGFDIQHNPHYIDTPTGERLWVDDNCAKGLQKLLDAFSINYQIKEA